MITKRDEVAKEDRWNTEAMYPSLETWEKEFKKTIPTDSQPFWPKLSSYQGRLKEGANMVKEVVETLLSLERKLKMLYTYAHLKHDEDISNDQYKVAYTKIVGVYHAFAQECSWFEPELLSLPESTLYKYLESPELQEFRFHLEKVIRLKPHTLSSNEERLIALSANAMQSTHKAFSAINDADFKFGSVLDKEGKERPITHASYGMYLREHDPVLRKNAFKKHFGVYSSYGNTLCELLNGTVQSHVFNARARNYESSLQAALYPKNIQEDVYHSLIHAVNDKMHAHHKYIALRKKLLDIDTLHLYDMYVPLTRDVDIKMSYKEAQDSVIESVAPLGTEYQNLLKKGLEEGRWVDRYENENKRSGAYSSGCYDSMPYILMNYKGIIRDVFTLAHEAGHSMHSLLCHKHQPFQYGNYSIFLAEVASTFNEDLLTQLLLERYTDPKQKAFLINQKIEDIRATLFRQTMFAEFELLIHTLAEKNIPLTPKLLSDEFTKLNKKYFGQAAFIDPEIEIEWARIPHFYYNFYVYQYATGISAALALSDRIIQGGDKERNDYLSFLKGGSSKHPLELLQIAGVNMSTPAPVTAAINKFEKLVDELDLALNTTKC